MNQIVLQFIDTNHNVFVNSGQILGYINRFFVKNLNSMQYCEDLENGFLFIFRDMKSFRFRCQPIPPEMLEEPKRTFFRGMNFFKLFFVPKKKFPKQGIDVHIKIVTGDPEQVIPHLKIFIHSIDEKIEISHINEQTINFHTPSYDILQKYLNSLMNRFGKFNP